MRDAPPDSGGIDAVCQVKREVDCYGEGCGTVSVVLSCHSNPDGGAP